MVENYQAAVADTENFWECHHRLEIQGPFVNSGELLNKCGMYENVPAWQLVFLKQSDHRALHDGNRSETTHMKLRKPKSAEHRAKISAARKGQKRSAETRAKISAARSAKIFGNHWWNNGTETKFCKECPGPGWKRGRLKH